jgi:predicted DNA-binding transcriptional regulator AlpA
MNGAKQHPRLATVGVEGSVFKLPDPNTPAQPGASIGIESLLTCADWSRILVVSSATVDRLRSAGKIPKADFLVGRLPRWHASTVRAWLLAQGGTNG